MIHKRNLVPFGREPEVADPTVRLIQNFPKRVLYVITPVLVVHDRKLMVWTPVRPADILQQLPRSAALKRGASQSSLNNVDA